MNDKRKLKIAVCFFGHLRSYKKCAPFLRQNLLKYYDCDLFMHTWAKLDHDTKTWHNLKKAEGDTHKENIIRAYGELKGIKIEEQHPKDFGNIRIKTQDNGKETQMSLFGIGAMFHSMREAENLCKEYTVKNKIKYDYVLFVRPDIWIKKPLEIEKLLLALSKEKIGKGFFTLAHSMSKLIGGFEGMGGTDLLFFATPTTMADIIENTTLAIKDYKPNMLIPHCPEYALIKLVRERGFTPYHIDFDMPKNWEISRISEIIKWRKRLISLRIRANLFRIWLFPKMMRHIVRFQVDLFGVFKIDFGIGNLDH